MTDSASPKVIEIDDDTGLLGLAIAAEYDSFVSPDWDQENRLWDHFQDSTDAGNLLVWSCGDGGDLYRIKVSEGFSDQKGFRESTGTLRPVDGKVHFVSYDALTMAAQFEDYGIPAENEADIYFPVSNEPLKIRLIQMYDPKTVDYDNFPPFHFLIEYEPGTADGWDAMKWDDVSAPPNFEDPLPAEGDTSEKKRGLLSRLFGSSKK